MNRPPTGHDRTVEETNDAPRHAAPDHDAPPAEPSVSHTVDGDAVRLVVGGELTEAARRPLVRAVTDLLLAEHALQRVELDLRDVGFMNSALPRISQPVASEARLSRIRGVCPTAAARSL